MKLKKCRSCGSKNLIKIISLGNQYLSDFTKINKKPKSFPLALVLCKTCHLVQLDYTTPAKYLYTERYGYKSGVNKTMQDELKEIVHASLKKTNKPANKIIAIDIGANDGTLLNQYPKNVYSIGVEPITKYAKECKKHANKVINNYFSFEKFPQKIKNQKADII